MLFSQVCMADELQIGQACYPKQIQAKFLQKGYKLDLSANDRDEKSWGFLNSEGSKYSIYTYKPITKEELDLIRKIVMEK